MCVPLVPSEWRAASSGEEEVKRAFNISCGNLAALIFNLQFIVLRLKLKRDQFEYLVYRNRRQRFSNMFPIASNGIIVVIPVVLEPATYVLHLYTQCTIKYNCRQALTHLCPPRPAFKRLCLTILGSFPSRLGACLLSVP